MGADDDIAQRENRIVGIEGFFLQNINTGANYNTDAPLWSAAYIQAMPQEQHERCYLNLANNETDPAGGVFESARGHQRLIELGIAMVPGSSGLKLRSSMGGNPTSKEKRPLAGGASGRL